MTERDRDIEPVTYSDAVDDSPTRGLNETVGQGDVEADMISSGADGDIERDVARDRGGDAVGLSDVAADAERTGVDTPSGEHAGRVPVDGDYGPPA